MTPKQRPLSFTRGLPVTKEAVAFARKRHAGQTRPGDQAAFVIHPLEAASLLERSGYPDQVVAAAVLHDVLEDTDTTKAELEERFGSGIADLVATVTEDPSISDKDERRDEVRERVRRLDGDALGVYVADKVSKVRELRALLATGVDPKVAEGKRRHYEKCLVMLEEELPGAPIAELLRFELEGLAEFPPAGYG